MARITGRDARIWLGDSCIPASKLKGFNATFGIYDEVTGFTHKVPPGTQRYDQVQQYLKGLPDASGSFTGSFIGSPTGRFTVQPVPQSFPGHPVPKKEVKPVYGSTGMTGFTERGPDEGWDMALGQVRGYRWWSWTVPARLLGHMANPPAAEFGKLKGAYDKNFEWQDGTNEARCHRGAPTWAELVANSGSMHEVPEYRSVCGCGFWAYWPSTNACAVSTFKDSVNPAYISIPVFGTVVGTGRVILGNKGFRSQYARIESLCIPDEALSAISYWDTGVRATLDRDRYSYNNLNRSLLGVDSDFVYSRSSVQAEKSEIVARLARLETELGELYPSAKILTGKDTLVKVFPPDANYGNLPGSPGADY